jgi:para-aminobenzoate synthetase / 4-amino-4-deoxychorismate lyase
MRSEPLCRLISRALDWELSAADVLRLVRDDAHPVALFGSWAGGRDIVAADPVRVCGAPAQVAAVLDAPMPGPDDCPERTWGESFGGGWIGYLGFGTSGTFLPVPPAPGEPRRLPAWWFGFYDHVLRRDRTTGRWTFEALWTPDRADALERRFAELAGRPHAAGCAPRGYSCGRFRMIPSAEEHKSAVRRTVSYIRSGDIFQANVCLRLGADFTGDPLDAFCRAATRLNPPYAAFIRTPDGAVASLSPELFLRRTGTSVLSQPIKGTRSRPAGEAAALRQRGLLERSAKDRAENVMIVDLMRNDLSRVCAPGSVQVTALLRAEAHPGVWHLVSDVRGTLTPGAAATGDGQLIAATFPPGSVTGAPKVRALEVIHELEAAPREVYTGAIGYRSPVAGLELNVAIRTFEFDHEHVWLGSGGGITARSDPDAEYRECLLKATPLVRALGGRIGREPAAPARGSVPPALRPRPATGVFTSLRVADGRGHDLDGHLARLDGSAWRLFGKHLPPGLDTDLAACLAKQPSGRLRITARPAGGPLRVTIEVIPAGPAPQTVALHPVTIPGGLGAHKWLDRRLLGTLSDQAGLGPDEHLLIQDGNGDVLETDRASIFAVIAGVVYTPPTDGRLLPGVTRAAVLRLARDDGIIAKEEPLSGQRLREASEVFVTNSVYGVRPARSLAGTDAGWEAGPVTGRLQAALAHRQDGPGRAAVRLTPSGRPAPPGRPASPARLASGRLGSAPRSRAGRARPAIILIDNYDSFTYNLAHLLLSGGCQVEVVRNDEVSAQDIAAAGPAGIVISPGPCAPADAGISVATVRACGSATPLLGICLGHQAIAAAYGARITTAERPVHGRASLITHDGRGVLSGLPRRFQAARYHSLIVEEDSLPPDVVITARGPGGIPMGLRHAQHPAEGVQFHPESILTTSGDVIIRNFIVVAREGDPAGRLR